jgi:arylsulfatase A-like enzyme
MTFMQALEDHGYRTSLVGKAHLQNITDIPAAWPTAAERRKPEAQRRRDGRYDQEMGPAWRHNPDHHIELPYYGFDWAAMVINHGDDVDGDYRRWLEHAHPEMLNKIGSKNAIPTPEFELPAFN